MFRLIGFSLVALILVGCETTSSIPYDVSTANVISVEKSITSQGKKARVGSFIAASGVDESPMCRMMGDVVPSPGKTLTQFVQQAFEKELYAAKALDPDAPVLIEGVVQKLDFSSVSPAQWNIALNVKSSNGTSYSVETTYKFETSFSAWYACQNVADAFGPTVQTLLEKVVNHPDFPKLF